MKVHRYESLPAGTTYTWGDPEELADYDFEELKDTAVEEAWYWYACGGYEGAGYIIMREGSSFFLHDMGHCSCYGPLDGATDALRVPYETLDALEAACTDDLESELAPLLKMARADA